MYEWNNHLTISFYFFLSVFGDIASSHLPKLEHFVFFDGTMRYIEACDVGGAFRDRCILNNYSEYMTKVLCSSCFFGDFYLAFLNFSSAAVARK